MPLDWQVNHEQPPFSNLVSFGYPHGIVIIDEITDIYDTGTH